MLTELPDAPGTTPPEPFAGTDHPMRAVTRQVAFEGGWSPGRAAKVAELFDSLAADWATRDRDANRAAPIRDALDRGDLPLAGRWAELGSGTGAGTAALDGRIARLVALDLSAEMLAHAPDLAPKVRADSSKLPFPDGSLDGALLVNMLLFPGEVDRILAPGGVLVWVNTHGDQTPIHLPPDDVVAALPGSWTGVTAKAGTGLWAAVRRAEHAA